MYEQNSKIQIELYWHFQHSKALFFYYILKMMPNPNFLPSYMLSSTSGSSLILTLNILSVNFWHFQQFYQHHLFQLKVTKMIICQPQKNSDFYLKPFKRNSSFSENQNTLAFDRELIFCSLEPNISAVLVPKIKCDTSKDAE